MFNLTSPLILGLAILASVLIPVVMSARRAKRQAHNRAQGIRIFTVNVLVIVTAQVLAITSVALWANNTYGFYVSWRDLVGDNSSATSGVTSAKPLGKHPVKVIPISADNPHPHGVMQPIALPNAQPPSNTALVWLPPQYFEKKEKTTKFPVLLIISGGKGTAQLTYEQFGSGAHELKAIKEGKASPFISVYVPNRYQPDLDVECLDLPGQPGGSWLAKDVVGAIQGSFRTLPQPQGWFASGVSTGGYCAAALMTKFPNTFAAGAGIAPFFTPLFDNPAAIPNHAAVVKNNSIRELAATGKLKRFVFLSVLSRTDTQSWGGGTSKSVTGQALADGGEFYAVAKHIPGTAFIIDDTGGHNFETFTRHLDDVFAWLGGHGL